VMLLSPASGDVIISSCSSPQCNCRVNVRRVTCWLFSLRCTGGSVIPEFQYDGHTSVPYYR
jgi:hypothetical protein